MKNRECNQTPRSHLCKCLDETEILKREFTDLSSQFLNVASSCCRFAIAGRIDIDIDKEPLGIDNEGKPVFLKISGPSDKEIQETIKKSLQPEIV